MKYSIRNTIILLLTLIIMVGGGWLYIHNRFDEEIQNTRATLNQKQIELEEVQNLADQFSVAQANYNDVVYTRENYPKELFPSHSSSDLYNYLQEINEDISFTELNYSLSDSVLNDDHGIINATIDGEGNYQNLTNFLYRIEYSRPLVQIHSVQLNNMSELENLNRVTFQINVGAYYRRGNWTTYRADLDTSTPLGSISHNPYYPLIRPIPPNDENLPDVEASRLIALTGRTAHIIDQTGVLKRLSVGDRVYLGQLSRISLNTNEAVFQLNRGGIMDTVTLSLSQSQDNS
jgi:hypothetical protein